MRVKKGQTYGCAGFVGHFNSPLIPHLNNVATWIDFIRSRRMNQQIHHWSSTMVKEMFIKETDLRSTMPLHYISRHIIVNRACV